MKLEILLIRNFDLHKSIKQLPSKTNFIPFLQLNFSNFRLKHCERL